MTISLTLFDDYVVFDGLESVTLRDYLGTSNVLTDAYTFTESVLRRRVTTKEAEASGGKYTTSDVVWHIPKALCPTQPKLGAKIVDSSSVLWTALEVQYNVIRNMWRITTRALAIVESLDTLVSIQKATFTRGTGGQMVPDWGSYLENVRGRLQRNDTTVVDKDSRRQPVARYTLFIEEQLELSQFELWRVVDSDGNTYSVLTAEKPDRVGELMRINLDDAPGSF